MRAQAAITAHPSATPRSLACSIRTARSRSASAWTGRPEVRGFTTREAIALLRSLAGLDIVAGDVVDATPRDAPTTMTAKEAAQILSQILCLMVRSPSFTPAADERVFGTGKALAQCWW